MRQCQVIHYYGRRDAFATKQDLWLHGWVYDIRDGRIKPLMEIDRDTRLEAVPHPQCDLLTNDEIKAASRPAACE